MKCNKMIFGILAVLLGISSCKKYDDNSFEEILDPINSIVGSFWMNSGNAFTELDLNDNQQNNAFTTLDSFRCSEFEGTFICMQGEHSGTKTLMRKGTFNGELLWPKEYVSDTEKYFLLNTTEIQQNTVFISYKIINSTSFNSTYHLEALNLDTGSVKWSIELVDNVQRITSLEDQIIAELSIVSSTTELLSIHIDDGHIDHRIPCTDRIGNLIGGSSSIFVMTWNNRIISMDHQLNFNWTFDTDSPNILGGFERGNQFLFYSRDETVYSIDTNTGSLLWKHAYFDDYPLAINTLNNKVYVSNRKAGESNIQIKTLDLFSGEELDAYTYATNQELNASATKYFFFDQHLLLFNIAPDDNKATIALINISDKIVVWEKELDQVAYPHLIITPTGYYL